MKDTENYQLNIDKFGCQVIYVMGEDDLPPFGYSIGINRNKNKSEIIVIGLKQEITHFIINEYCERIKNEEIKFRKNDLYSGYLGGFDVKFGKVLKKYYDEYLGQCLSYYKSDEFQVVQLIYPNTKGIFPDSDQADDWFVKRQPLLFS